MSTAAIAPEEAAIRPTVRGISDEAEFSQELQTRVTAILSRRPAIGVAIGLVRGQSFTFCGRGVADIASKTLVTEDTVFRIGSITKTFTAVAVMQLFERGLIDLDAPANAYLRSFRLVDGGFRPPTVRHLLTHTAGIPDMRRVADLLHAGLTPDDGRPPLRNVAFGERLPALAEYYRGGLRVVSEPGQTFAYSNHGFATLGQIIEDIAGLPLERYFRERVFEPLGMVDTDLVRSERLASRLATGYVLKRRGASPVPDRDWIGAAGGGIYSTTRDLARYAAALLGTGSNDHGSILEPATLATMFDPQYQPDPRLVGLGLGFFRSEIGGHRVVGHDGILPGFNSSLLIAPDDGVAVIGLTNGSPGAFGWLAEELEALLGQLLDVRADPGRTEVPHHPEIWSELCGRYVLPRVADLRQRLMFGGGAEVLVRSGRLRVRILTPIPALLRGIPLEPDDATDPYVFRLDLTPLGMSVVRIVFARVAGARVTAVHTDLGGQPWSLVRVPEAGTGPGWLRPIAGTVAIAGVAAVLRRRARASRWRSQLPPDVGASALPSSLTSSGPGRRRGARDDDR